MKSITPLALSFALCASSFASPLSDWFAKPAAERGKIPATASEFQLGSMADINKAKSLVWKEYKAGATQNSWDKNLPAKALKYKDWVDGNQTKALFEEIGDKSMPYVVITNGSKPSTGWPVYFGLHGGGRNPNATTPHGWRMNDMEWRAQMSLATTMWKAPGLYIIPRMADDRDGRWYYGYNQVFIDRMIQSAILFNDADPNQIYLMGISEGGYTAFRLGSMMADRWAGSCAMAAAEPLNTSPPENLRHVAFRCGIGEKDTMFNRHILARDYFKKLAELQKEHPGQYINHHDEQKGRGHGINYEPGPKWIAQYKRNPVPTGITWTVIEQHDRHRNRMYWLTLDDYQGPLPLMLTADAKDGNVIEITAHVGADDDRSEATDLNLRVYLSEKLVNLSKPVTVQLNGKEVFKGKVKPSMDAIIRSTAERGDPEQVFAVQVPVKG